MRKLEERQPEGEGRKLIGLVNKLTKAISVPNAPIISSLLFLFGTVHDVVIMSRTFQESKSVTQLIEQPMPDRNERSTTAIRAAEAGTNRVYCTPSTPEYTCVEAAAGAGLRG